MASTATKKGEALKDPNKEYHPNWGGSREGGGRPKTGTAKVPVAYRLSQDVAAFLNTIENRSVYIDDMIRRSKAFRDWAKNQS